MSAAALRAVGFTLLLLLVGAPTSFAISADPTPAEFVQPGGARITLRLNGDEYLHWYSDLTGHPVVREGMTWRYAARDSEGALVATSLAVGEGAPEAVGSTPGLRPQPSESTRRVRLAALRPLQPGQRVNTQPTGVVKNLVILCRFSDQPLAAYCRAPSAYDSLFNADQSTGPNAPTGSVKDFYAQASYGLLSLRSDIVGWVNLPHPEVYYSNNAYGLGSPFKNTGPAPYPNNAGGMIHDALVAADSIVNFASYDANNDGFVDAIDFIHSGYGGEAAGGGPAQIWSHQGNLNNTANGGIFTSNDKNANGVNVKVDLYHTEPARWGASGDSLVRVGVIAHETGHFFGLPDLYDHTGASAGLGSWCTMANSWGWDNRQFHPPIFSAWCKLKLGWVAPEFVNAPATYALGACETTPAILRTSAGMPSGEYLLVENREPIGFDSLIPRGGIAIYHIDDNKAGNDTPGFPGQPGWPASGVHDQVMLLQADGRYDLEKLDGARGDSSDLYRASNVAVIHEATTPNTNSLTGSMYPTGTDIRVSSEPGTTMNVTVSPGYWVDFSAAGPEFGIFSAPFHSVATAMVSTPANGAMIFKPGTSHELPTLTKPMLLRSWNGAAIIGR